MRTDPLPPHPSTTASGSPGLLRGIGTKLFGDDGLTFRDVLDLVNPLQHIPLVGNLYRKLTGDTIDPAIQVAGGALFGGPIGAALSAVGVMLERHETSPVPGVDATPAAAIAQIDPAPRGGWLLAAARSGRMPPPAPPSTAAMAEAGPAKTESRRGGWIFAQAYAMNDLVRRATELAAHKIDDRV